MINAFDFDEKAFREYYLLRLYVHDSHVAPKRIGLYVFLLIPGVTIDLVLVLSAWRDMAGWGVVDDLTMLATIVAFLLFFGGFVHSVYLSFGRRLDWESPRWRARMDTVFEELGRGATKSPVPEGFDRTFAFMYIVTGMASIGDKWHNEGIYLDSVPYLLPKFISRFPAAPHSVPFQASFLEDRIEKGRSGEVFAFSYGDVFDIVLYEKHPQYAIIRHKDKVSELVIRKDAFKECEWQDVKRYILEKKKEEERGLKQKG